MMEPLNQEKLEQLTALLTSAVEQDASDIFLIPGMPVAFKLHGQIEAIDERKIFPEEMNQYINAIYALTNGRTMKKVLEAGTMTSPSPSRGCPVSGPA